MNHSYRFPASFALLLILIFSIAVYAQGDPRLWDAEGIPLRLGDHLEWLGSSAVNEYGQTCVTWCDAREGYWDVYAQVIAPNGSMLWTNRGVVVNNSIWRQEDPAVIAVNGGWIIAWLDWRYGDRFHYTPATPQCAVFAQKLSMSGERLWADEGVEVHLADDWYVRDASLRLSADQSGGAIIGWREYIPAEGYSFNTQRINGAGALVWAEPITVTTELNWNSDVQTEQDEAGNMLAVWLARVDSTTTGVFAAKITPSGVLPWGEGVNGIRLGSVPGNCLSYDICRDETTDGFYLVWCDRGTGYVDYAFSAQRFDVNGIPQWGDAGVLLFEPDDELYDLIITPNYSGEEQDGFLLSGRKSVPSTSLLVVQKVDASGTRLWGEEGIEVAEMYSYSSWDQPKIQTDFSGGCIAVWSHNVYDSDDGEQGYYLRAARISDSGVPLWGEGGVTIHSHDLGWLFMGIPSYVRNSDYVRAFYQELDYLGYKSISFADGSAITESAAQILPTIHGEGSNPSLIDLENSRIAVLWSDERNGNRLVYFQVIDTLGTPLLEPNGIRLDPDNDALPLSWYSGIHTCGDGNGGFFASATVRNGSIHPIILYHVEFDETMEHSISRFMVTDSARGYDDYFYLTPDGRGGCFVAWGRYTPDFETEMVMQRFNDACEPLWPDPMTLTPSSQLLKLEQTSDGCCIAVYKSEREDIWDVTAMKIDQSGTILWSMELIDNSSYHPAISCQSDGNGGLYFCYDNSNLIENPGIYLQHADANGTPQWPEHGIHVDNDNGWDPNLLFDEQYGLYVVWKDGFGMRAQQIDLNGTMHWAEDGLQLASDYYAVIEDLTFNAEGGLFCLWTQYDVYNSSVLYGMDLNPDGTPASAWWTEGTGNALSTDERYAFNARLAPFHDGTSLIVWEGQVWGEEEYSLNQAKPNFYYYIDLYAQRVAIGENTLDTDAAPRSVPITYSLHQNYPNPFNPSTTISFTIPQAGSTALVVYDLLGRTVETIMDRQIPAGNYHILWNAEALPSGVYFYRLTSGDFMDTKKTVLLK